jgi:hypothetical protein
MSDAIDYCPKCTTNVECHLERSCFRNRSSLAPATGSVAVADTLARDMACALWECSKIRHGLFTPVEFIPLAAGVLREYLAKKTSNPQSEPRL